MRESRENRAEFSDTIEAFEILLRYIYSGKMRIPNFSNISFNTLCEILGHESLSAEEIDIVKATLKWIHANKPEAPKIFEIFKHISLSLIPGEEYNSLLVELTAYVTPDNLVEFVKEQKKAHNSRAQYHRGIVATENVATVEKGAKVLEGIPSRTLFVSNPLTPSDHLFNGKVDFNQYVYQQIGKPLTIQLGRPYFIESFG
uniref:BACK domain-containing protein n=1 Tax=Acrobeloides nanus TaxID=290746 RepID=A0A914E2F6_9BILA